MPTIAVWRTLPLNCLYYYWLLLAVLVKCTQQEKLGFLYKKIPPAGDLLQILLSVRALPVPGIIESFVGALKAILSIAKRLHSPAPARLLKIAAMNRILVLQPMPGYEYVQGACAPLKSDPLWPR